MGRGCPPPQVRADRVEASTHEPLDRVLVALALGPPSSSADRLSADGEGARPGLAVWPPPYLGHPIPGGAAAPSGRRVTPPA